jgi:hypothetical protein
MKIWIDGKDLIWQSDFDGEDIGYPDVGIVGFYMWNNRLLEINSETGEILNISNEDDETFE